MYLGEPRCVADHRAVLLEHAAGVEGITVPDRRDARIDDVETELVEYRGGACKTMATVWRVDQDRKGAAGRLRLDVNAGLLAVAVRARQHSGVARDLRRRIAQKIR